MYDNVSLKDNVQVQGPWTPSLPLKIAPSLCLCCEQDHTIISCWLFSNSANFHNLPLFLSVLLGVLLEADLFVWLQPCSEKVAGL